MTLTTWWGWTWSCCLSRAEQKGGGLPLFLPPTCLAAWGAPLLPRLRENLGLYTVWAMPSAPCIQLSGLITTQNKENKRNERLQFPFPY